MRYCLRHTESIPTLADHTVHIRKYHEGPFDLELRSLPLYVQYECAVQTRLIIVRQLAMDTSRSRRVRRLLLRRHV